MPIHNLTGNLGSKGIPLYRGSTILSMPIYFQRLVYRGIGRKPRPANAAYLPQGLDIPAAMGSEEAYRIPGGGGIETQCKNYPQNIAAHKEHIAGFGCFTLASQPVLELDETLKIGSSGKTQGATPASCSIRPGALEEPPEYFPGTAGPN